ncbi:hypothetical protein LTS18_006204 [Coniosporium uncinatum]|uniref:Uncharacterized protein n=1 Tax=Coniosporium uncinatum TaxID=93489 RepID=A0ACC3DDI7_9PEZI|nr:hypothetical protein LTS18_006204 [Coniosporium uncinatum]
MYTRLRPEVSEQVQKMDADRVPFRATTTHHHHTWAQTFHSFPELYIRPQTLEEIQKAVNLARKCRRRLVVVGCAHSPSELTMTSAWMMNLDGFNQVMKVDKESRIMTVQGGIRLNDLNMAAKEHGLTMPNLGSIDQQSIVGAMATATHGSSLTHGLISASVRSLRIVLANGRVVRCSPEQSPDLFRAALVSLGALGVIVEVEFQMGTATNIEWTQTLKPLSYILNEWGQDLWTQEEFTRVWWLPYTDRAIVWRAHKTEKPQRPPATNWYGHAVGFHTYRLLLWISHYIPPLLPAVEWFVFGMQYGFALDAATSAIEEQRTGLLMNCLYSQFVNEWALPLRRGPEAIRRMSAWIHGDQRASGLPFSPKGVYVHCPIEVRVSDTTPQKHHDSDSGDARPFLDSSEDDGPTLYLNATLYRPFGLDPPCMKRYYEAFEYLMKELGGRPHWAKNFQTVSHADLQNMYGENLTRWLRVRESVDPDGMFLGDWHRRLLMPEGGPDGGASGEALALEERRQMTKHNAQRGGEIWYGEQPANALPEAKPRELFNTGRDANDDGNDDDDDAAKMGPEKEKRQGSPQHSLTSKSSEESFDQIAQAETEASVLLREVEGTEEEFEHGLAVGKQRHPGADEGWDGTKVFHKM